MSKISLILCLLALQINVVAQANEKLVAEPIIFACSFETKPEFPGGEKALFRYLAENVKYPRGAKNVVGRVFVQFTVEKDGSITNVKLLRGIGRVFDEAALEVVANMPKWSPGKQNGKVVKIIYNLPFYFSL
jgi:TonB family protein